MSDKTNKQIKSKQRVKDHGEVFTNPREVNAMLDLVKDESYRVGSRFLEPACGNGNFLVEILNRKLQTVKVEYNKNQEEFEKYIFIAVSSIYAIDIQEDNCEESRERMFNIIKNLYNEVYPAIQNEKFLSIISKILEMNVILGDGLTGLQVGVVNKGNPIVFSEWTFIDNKLIRKDFTMNDMISYNQRVEQEKELLEKNKKEGGLLAMMTPKAEKKEMEPVFVKEYIDIYEII